MSETSKYSLAVVIPCWNEEKLLHEMLDCLLRQTYRDWVAFCVDDQSTDGTAAVIKDYQAKDARIQYVCRDREPKGGQTCRNIGLEKAAGAKYVCFFDADDLVAPYCFEQRVQFMETHPELDCGVFPALAYAEDIHEENGPIFGVRIFEDDIQAMLNTNLCMTGWTNIYKVASMRKYSISWDVNVKSMQDSDFSFQMLLSDMKYDFAKDAKADYFYHVGNDGVAKKIKTKRHYDSHLYCLDKISKAISAKYGSKYDFYIESRIVGFFGTFRGAWYPYFSILRMPWMKHRWGFKMRILLYLMILKKDRRLIFRKYRKYSKHQNAIWAESMAKKRKELLALISEGVNE